MMAFFGFVVSAALFFVWTLDHTQKTSFSLKASSLFCAIACAVIFARDVASWE